MPDGNPGPPENADWAAALRMLERHPTKYGSLSWIASRPLIASLNDVLSRFTGGLVTDLRRDWIRRTPAPRGRLIERPTSSWLIIGDTGEQDGSQYVVCRALSEMSRDLRIGSDGADPGFLLVMSDVIYPAGDVDDYPAAVYKPYRMPTDPADDPAGLAYDFTVSQPMYALPGNHDWYDGLSGFMYHFAGQDPPEVNVYAPSGRHPLHHLFRILWRRPRAAGADAVGDRNRSRLSHDGPIQPGPYYAIQTEHVLLVCIDTGIDGRVDADQYAWLQDVSRGPGAKLLVTGKPLAVDGQLHRTEVTGMPRLSVWDLVSNPEFHYVATLGGDIHNFQLYPRNPGEQGPFAHLVSGGGGAYMHATHVHHTAANNHQLRPKTELYGAAPTMTFPNTAQSLRFFAYRLISGVSRAMVNLTVMILALVVAVLAAAHAPGIIPVVAGLALLLVAAGLRAAHRGDQRTDPRPRRIVTWLGAPGVGFLTGGLAHRLDPGNVLLYLLAAAGLVVFLSLVAAIARQSRWWVGLKDTFAQPQPVSGLFLAGACAAAAVGQVWLDEDHSWWWGAPAAVIFGIGVVGAFARRRHSAWQRWSTRITLVGQIAFTLLVVGQVAVRAGRHHEFASGILGGLVGLIAVTAATAILLLLVTEAVALRFRPGRNRRLAWGRAAAATSHLPIVILLLVAGGWVGVAPRLAQVPWLARLYIDRPAVGLPSVLVLVVAILFTVDFLRRRWPRGYLAVVIPAALALSVALLTLWPQWWWIRVLLAALVVIFGVLVGATLVHFSFLGAYWLVLPSYRQIIDAGNRGESELLELLPDQELYEVFTARENRREPTSENSGAILFWIRMTAPGLSDPGGLMQRLVAELFSSDKPRFYKSFLSFASRLEGDRVVLTMTLHQIFGDLPSTVVTVGELHWPAQPTADWAVSGCLRSGEFS